MPFYKALSLIFMPFWRFYARKRLSEESKERVKGKVSWLRCYEKRCSSDSRNT